MSYTGKVLCTVWELDVEDYEILFLLGMQYKMSDGFVFVRRVLDYLKWDKTIIMGHSMGGGIGE